MFDHVSLELAKKLKQLGYSEKTSDFYLQVFEGVENYDEDTETWVYNTNMDFKCFIAPINKDFTVSDSIPDLLPGEYCQPDNHWIQYLDETFSDEGYVDLDKTDDVRRNWNIDLRTVIEKLLLNEEDYSREEKDLWLLRCIPLDRRGDCTPGTRVIKTWLENYAESELVQNAINEIIVDDPKNYEPDELIIVKINGEKVYLDPESIGFIYIPEIYSTPSPQDVISWLDKEKNLHICINYSNSGWTGQLYEHPATAVKTKTYSDCIEKLIDDSLDYLSIIE